MASAHTGAPKNANICRHSQTEYFPPLARAPLLPAHTLLIAARVFAEREISQREPSSKQKRAESSIR
jgi:hypothetical protein